MGVRYENCSETTTDATLNGAWVNDTFYAEKTHVTLKKKS